MERLRPLHESVGPNPLRRDNTIFLFGARTQPGCSILATGGGERTLTSMFKPLVKRRVVDSLTSTREQRSALVILGKH